MAATTVSMKLLIDTTKVRRVLFAEAGKDCVDFLFHILSLPIATVIRLLQHHEMEGSLPNLYQSLNDLNDTYIQPNTTKDTFLKPVAPLSSSSVPLLALNDAPTDKKVYGCHNCSRYFCDVPNAVCPYCGQNMTQELTYVNPPAMEGAASLDGGLVKGVVTYMVMDDLVVKPMSTISSLILLNKFKVKEVGALEEKVITFGMDEAVKLLKASLDSNTVLTDVFC